MHIWEVILRWFLANILKVSLLWGDAVSDPARNLYTFKAQHLFFVMNSSQVAKSASKTCWHTCVCMRLVCVHKKHICSTFATCHAVFCHNDCQFFKTTEEKPAGNGGIPEELRLFDFDSGLHCSKCCICESLLGISKYLKGKTNNMLQQCRSLKESSSTGTS